MSFPIRLRTSFLAAAVLAAAPLQAGVVFQLETTDYTGPEPRKLSNELSVAAPNLKIVLAPGEDQPPTARRDEVIYRGDRREMLVIDRSDETHLVMDAESIQAMGEKVQAAMKELEKSLEELDPKQREVMQKMLQEDLGELASGKQPPPSDEVRVTKERATHSGFPTVRHDVLRDGQKVLELWVTDWDNIEGGKEAAGVFRSMAEFAEQMMSAVGQKSAGTGGLFARGRDPLAGYRLANGFPVVSRSFRDGELTSETILTSVTERKLVPAEFEPPEGSRKRTVDPR